MRICRFLLGLTAATLMAQGPGRALGPRAGMGMGQQGGGQPALTAVKAALELTDQQVQQLVQLREEERKALQPLREQAQEKRKALQAARQAANPNPATVGQLVLDLQSIMGQVRAMNVSYHTKALDVLTPVQKEKLQTLEAATERVMRAQRVAAGARALNLLLPPARNGGAAD